MSDEINIYVGESVGAAANSAAAAAASALDAAVQALAAAASAQGRIFASYAAGDAATIVGQYFYVTASGSLDLHLHGSATPVSRLPLLDATGALEVAEGIKFPATQNPSSNANTLDDYEEGTATLGLKFGATAQATTSQVGYTKIGRLVTISGYVAMDAAVSGTGEAYLTGLPFTSGVGTAGGISVASLSLANVSFTGQYSGFLTNGATEIALWQTAEAGGRTALNHANFASNSEVEFTLTYAVA